MLLFYDHQVIVIVLLFLVTLYSSVFASILDDKNNTKTVAKTVVSSIRFAWIDGMGSVRYDPGSSCEKEIAVLSEAVSAEEMWALRMLDASSKIQPGILEGNIIDLGMYSECVKVDEKYNGVNVRGKHCMVKLDFEELKLTSSVCIPSSCNETEASQIVSFMTKNFLANSSLVSRIKTTVATCAHVGSKDFTIAEILTIVFLSAVGAFIIACTICDCVRRTWPNWTSVKTVNTLAKFSLYKNASTVFNMRVKPGTMTAVNGIRFLSTSWIVLKHRYSTMVLIPMVNSSDYSQWSISWHSVWVKMATFATDNFFIVSGFLMTYLFFKSMKSGNKFNLPMMYFHRYIRITPPVAVATIFLTFLYHRLGNGPFWKNLMPRMIGGCEKNWWVNFLYVQNFLSAREMCYVQTWFLAADMQLFFISPIILYPLHRWPKYGLGVLSLFLIMSVVIPSVIVGIHGYSIIIRNFLDTSGSFENYHIRFYTRAFPYLMGIFLGYEIGTKKRHLSRAIVVISWIVTCIMLVFCVVALHYLNSSDVGYYPGLDITCAVILRPCWSIAMSWIIYACTQGHGGALTRFLSLPIFVPLCRLSYGIYLVHTPIILLSYGTSTIPAYFSNLKVLTSYFGQMVLSIAMSVVITLFIEFPVMVLEKILTNRGHHRGRAVPAQDKLISRKKDSEHLRDGEEVQLQTRTEL